MSVYTDFTVRRYA